MGSCRGDASGDRGLMGSLFYAGRSDVERQAFPHACEASGAARMYSRGFFGDMVGMPTERR